MKNRAAGKGAKAEPADASLRCFSGRIAFLLLLVTIKPDSEQQHDSFCHHLHILGYVHKHHAVAQHSQNTFEILPYPPLTLTPPNTTAVSTSNSKPFPARACPELVRDSMTTPAIPENNPDNV